MLPPDTRRLKWRRLVAADLEVLQALHTDPEVMRWIGGPEPPEQVAAALDRWSRPVDPRFGVWAGETEGRFAGWWSLEPLHASTGVLGYRLHRRAWGRGLATEGAAAVLEHAFGAAGLERVIAQTYQDNLASQAVMARLGMRLVRRFRLDAAALAGGQEWPGDEVEYEILAGEWAAR